MLQGFITSHAAILQPGYTFVANQVNTFGGNNVMNVLAGLPNPPLGSPFQIIKWNGTLQIWQAAAFFNNGVVWTGNLAMTLNPGSGVIIYSPMPTAFVFTFPAGAAVTPLLPLGLMAGNYYQIGRQDSGPGSWNTIVGSVEQDGDVLYRFTPPGAYEPYVYDSSLPDWLPSAPLTLAEESVWVRSQFGTVGNLPPSVPPQNFDLKIAAASEPPALAPPTILVPPAGTLLLSQGDTSSLAVVTGNYASEYQWFHAGVPRAEGTHATLIFNSVQLADAGDYWVVASNPFGSVTSSVAAVTVTIPPSIVVFAGVTNTSLGAASLKLTNEIGQPTQLVVGNLGSSGNDGVSIGVGPSTQYEISLVPIEVPGIGSNPVRWLTRSIGSTNGGTEQSLEQASFTFSSNQVDLVADLSGIGPGPDRVQILKHALLQADFAIASGSHLLSDAGPVAVGRLSGPKAGLLVRYASGTTLTIGDQSWEADELRLLRSEPATQIDQISRFEITAASLGSFSILGIQLNPPRVTHSSLVLQATGRGSYEIHWIGDDLLESALSLNGPWTEEPNSASPFQVVPTGERRFFRLQGAEESAANR